MQDIHIKELKKIQTGKIRLERTIDLHGADKQQAFDKLVDFFEASINTQIKYVRVITGKGPSVEEGQEPTGVLRSALIAWVCRGGLEKYVRAMSPAHPQHGGQGAFYLALKRKNKVL